MKNIIFFLSLMFMLPMISCSSSKDVAQRRSLMMPKTSEVPRNKRYKEIDYSHRNKHQTKTKSRR